MRDMTLWYLSLLTLAHMTHSYALRHSLVCHTPRVTWLICMCDMTLSYSWLDSFICATSLSRVPHTTCDMTHLYVWHDSFICVTWLFHIRDLTHSYALRHSLVCHTPGTRYTHLYIFRGKVVLICFVGSVNSVLKFLGQPGETWFQPGGDEISSGVPMTFNTKLTEPKGK